MNDDAAIILIQVGCRFIGKEDWRLLDESRQGRFAVLPGSVHWGNGKEGA